MLPHCPDRGPVFFRLLIVTIRPRLYCGHINDDQLMMTLYERLIISNWAVTAAVTFTVIVGRRNGL